MQSKLPYLLLGSPLPLEFLDEFVTVDVVRRLPGVILVTITLPLQQIFDLLNRQQTSYLAPQELLVAGKNTALGYIQRKND